MISKELIQQLREMERKATKGPWKLVMLVDYGEKGENEMAVIEAAQEEAVTLNPYTEHVMSSVQYYPKRVREDDMEFLTLLRNAYPALITAAEECERLREEVERLKQTSVEVEKPDGSKAYVQMHCTYPHDHIANPDIGFKML